MREQQIRDASRAAFSPQSAVPESASDAFDFSGGVGVAVLFGIESDDL
jgi:hypothetical protein